MKQAGTSLLQLTTRPRVLMSSFDTCKLPFIGAEAEARPYIINPMCPDVLRPFSDTRYHFCEGQDATSHASFGEAVQIAYARRGVVRGPRPNRN